MCQSMAETIDNSARLGLQAIDSSSITDLAYEQLKRAVLEMDVYNQVEELRLDELELRLAVRQQARHSTELNDDVVQALSLAKASFQVGETDQAITALDQALAASKRILAELAEDARDLRRTIAAG